MGVQLDVVGIATADMAASLKFYRLLGLAVPGGVDPKPHVEVDLGGLRIAWDAVDILQDVYGGWEEPSGHRTELAFRCDTRAEVDAVYAGMTGHGYRGHKAPWDALWGQRYAIIEDPDGNLLSLYA
jgi:catechol 2,3-dioxygenase-like lactoylglutathione lyase family enzyme